MAELDRGFRAWAERTSAGVRRDLGLAPHTPLDPARLASYLDVVLWTPHNVPGLPKDVLAQLLHRDCWGWSAVSCLVENQAIIIYNPSHSKGRQASDVMHELAHLILDHKAATMIMSQDGAMVMRSYDRKQEEEADWLSRCLLLPRDALMRDRRAGLTTTQIAVNYGVTEILVTYRLRMTGVDAQLKAAAKRRRA